MATFSTNSSSGKIDPLHPMVVLQPGERVVCEIKRHPFGLMSAYAAGGTAIIMAVILAALAPHFADQYNYDGNISSIAYAVVAVVVVGVGGILAVATKVYWENQWIVTDDSITQVTQNSLLGRRVSQLSMENLEDITVDQHGIIQTMFNFGTLRAETAGEHSKFFFMFCPDPNSYARKILEVHESFLYQGRHEHHEFDVDPMPNQYTAPGQKRGQPFPATDAQAQPAADNNPVEPQQYTPPQSAAYYPPAQDQAQSQQYAAPFDPTQPQQPAPQDQAFGPIPQPPQTAGQQDNSQYPPQQ